MKQFAALNVVNRVNQAQRTSFYDWGVPLGVLAQPVLAATKEYKEQTPYFLRLRLDGPTFRSREIYRIPTPEFDLAVVALATNVSLSAVKLFVDGEPITDDDTPLWSLGAPHNINRRVFEWSQPLFLPAFLPVEAELFYADENSVPAGYGTPEIILHCRKVPER